MSTERTYLVGHTTESCKTDVEKMCGYVRYDLNGYETDSKRILNDIKRILNGYVKYDLNGYPTNIKRISNGY